MNSYQAGAAGLTTGIETNGTGSVRYSQSDFIYGFRFFMAMILLAIDRFSR